MGASGQASDRLSSNPFVRSTLTEHKPRLRFAKHGSRFTACVLLWSGSCFFFSSVHTKYRAVSRLQGTGLADIFCAWQPSCIRRLYVKRLACTSNSTVGSYILALGC